MASPSDFDTMLLQRVRVMQITSLAVLQGMVIFAVVVLVIRGNMGFPLWGDPSTLTVLAIGVFAALAVLALIVPDQVAKRMCARLALGTLPTLPNLPPGDISQLLTVFQTRLLLRLALLDAAALFAIIAYLIDGHALAVVLAGVGLIKMLLFFPTRGSVQAWMERQAEWIAARRRDDSQAA